MTIENLDFNNFILSRMESISKEKVEEYKNIQNEIESKEVHQETTSLAKEVHQETTSLAKEVQQVSKIQQSRNYQVMYIKEKITSLI